MQVYIYLRVPNYNNVLQCAIHETGFSFIYLFVKVFLPALNRIDILVRIWALTFACAPSLEHFVASSRSF